MGTFQSGSSGGANITAVGRVRDLFTTDKFKLLSLGPNGNYTVTAGKTLYIVAVFLQTAGANPSLLKAGSANMLNVAGASSYSIEIASLTLPVSTGSQTLPSIQSTTQGGTAPTATDFMNLSAGAYRIDQDYIWAVSAGVIVSFTSSNSACYVYGFEV